MQSLTVTAGPTVAYEYNSAGIRTKKTVGGMLVHQYTLDGSKIIRETVKNNGTASYDLYYLYDKSGSVIGFIYNNTYYYFQKNLQGDVIRILDYSGNVVVEYTYDAWGNVLTTTGSLAGTIGQYNPFRYRGYYYDIETGWYYLQSRYYDPIVGRFLNADHPELIGANGGAQGFNLIAYCNNDPIQFSDAEGTCVHGDGFFWFQFAGHDLVPGQACRVCHKVVDETFFRHPYEWTRLAQTYSHLSGEDISQMVRCTIAHDEARNKSQKGRTQAEKQEIYEKEMAAALCFVAGTIVKTENGDEVIEDIQVGDYVWAHNPETGETALKRVVQTFRNETTELVTITAGDDVIEATPEHPFYVPDCDEPRGNSTGLGKGWVKAKDLRQGDVLVLLDGSAITVDAVTTRILSEYVTVYNFEVEDYHTYFVGNVGWLVHNDCGTSRPSATGAPNSVYTQYANDGTIISIATYNSNGLLATRVDFGHAHFIKGYGYCCPHVHSYQYNAMGQPCGKSVSPY